MLKHTHRDSDEYYIVAFSIKATIINNNGALDMCVSYKFSSHTLLHIHKIRYFMGDFYNSVWSLPLCHNV